MTAGDKRLERLYPALSAKERAVLILRAWKEGRDHDPRIRRTVPDAQLDAYGRLIGLLQGASDALSHYIVVVHQLVEQLDLRYAWLATLHLYALDASLLTSYFTMDSDEPITQSEYGEREAEAQKAWLSVRDLAEALCLQEDGGDESDAPWQKRLRAKLAEFARLVKAGTLVGEGRGARLRIEAASYYAWRGEPVPVLPEWSRAYAVRPDGEREAVERDRAARRRARMLLGHFALSVVDGRAVDHEDDPVQCTGDLIAGGLIETVRAAWPQRWRELRAAEVVADEVADELDGEDPLHPEVRELLAQSRSQLLDLHKKLAPYTGPLPQEEPDDALVDRLRKIVHQEAS